MLDGKSSFAGFLARHESQLSPELEAIGKRVLDALFEVHRHLPPGLTERTSENALCRELDLRGINYHRQAPVDVEYKGEKVGEGFIDVLVEGEVILELKSVESLSSAHRAQVVYYLAAKKLELGYLVNFNVAMLKDGLKRIANSKSR